jgi:uncharacterized repeat protein (TIGR03803 family)
MTFYQKRLRTLAPAKQKRPMKTKLKLCALITFALAVGLRIEAQTKTWPAYKSLLIDDFGEPRDLSGPDGTPTIDEQGNVYVAFGIGDASGIPSLYDGGVIKFSGFVPVTGDWNGDGIITQQIVHTFADGSDGAYASTGPVFISADGKVTYLIGATSGGGDAGVGVLYAVGTGTGVNVTSSFAAPAAMDVNANGIAVGPVEGANGIPVYVSQQTGGPSDSGAVLKLYVTQSGGVIAAPPVHNFDGYDGKYPFLIEVASSSGHQSNAVKPNGVNAKDDTSTNYALYGVTFFGGTNAAETNSALNYGTVFKVNNDGSGFQTLYVFSSQRATNGYGPACGLALSGNTLYGTTSGGGSGGSGTVFKIDTSGSNFMVLKSFSAWGTEVVNGYYNYTNSDGMAPEGGLILSGDTLYGTTMEGGTNGGGGTVYSINTNGNNFTLLHSFTSPNNNGSGVFTNIDGGGTRAGLMLTGHVLFGTTPYGGIYGGGTVFAIILPSPPSLKIAPAGGNFAVSWPSSATNFMLQKNLTLNSQTWSNFNGTVNDDGTNKSVSVIPAAGNAFFRLLNTNGP